MFNRFISLLVLVVPLVSALTLSAPTNVNNGGLINITWTTDSSDPSTWSLELVNPIFNNAFAILNNVDPSLGSASIECPTVPVGGNYLIEAVAIGNISDIIASTTVFSIGAIISSSTSVTASATGTNTIGLTSTANSLPVTSSTPVSGSVSSVSGSVSSSGTGINTGSNTGTGTDTGTAATTTPSTAAAVSSRLALTNGCGYAVLLLSAVAGVAAAAF